MSGARRLISAGSPFEATIGFSRAVCVGDRVMISGTAPRVEIEAEAIIGSSPPPLPVR